MSGGAKMKAAGLHAIMLGVTPTDWDKLKQAAAFEGRAVSQFVRFHAVRAATQVLVAHCRYQVRKKSR